MPRNQKLNARKAAWLAFGFVVLASAVTPPAPEDVAASNNLNEAPNNPGVPIAASTDMQDAFSSHSDTTAEANRAYKSAIQTLRSLSAHPSSSFLTSAGTSSTGGWLAHYLPGPLGAGYRAVARLHNDLQQSLSAVSAALGFAAPTKPGFSKNRKGPYHDAEEERIKSIKVMDLLQHAMELGHDDAIYTLAQTHLFPPNAYFTFSPRIAVDLLQTHVDRTGHPKSHALLGFFYASEYRPLLSGNHPEPVVNTSQSKAMLHYTFAAHQGHKGAQMALGYRYWSGIGTTEDCSSALEWYNAAASEAMKRFLAGPPGGLTLPRTPTRLSDLEGGIYGPGASVASSGHNAQRAAIKAGAARAAGETWEDILEYYIFNANRGEDDFAYRLGRIFYQGSIYPSPGGIASGSEGVAAVRQDFAKARYYFSKVAREAWPKDPANPGTWSPPSPTEQDPAMDKHVAWASAAAGYLGRMYLRGEGVKQDFAMAKLWFERGAQHNDRESHNGLGIIWRDGLVTTGGKSAQPMGSGKVNIQKAVEHFTVAASKELAEASVNLGKHHYALGDMTHAIAFFENAVRTGSPFEAYYYLGAIHEAQAKSTSPALQDSLKASECSMAVSFYKVVAERGIWDDNLLREAEASWVASGVNDVGLGWIGVSAASEQSKEVALLRWWLAAERGHEIAQNNLAWILDQDKSILRQTRFSPSTTSSVKGRLALTQWTRAAGQRNVDALVKVADYYYHGLGISDVAETASDTRTRLEKAARYYQSAADTYLSALAMWNLGWLYENGVGVDKDFHLAKRYYDLAMMTHSEAYLPGLISLVKLYAKSIWHTLKGGEDGLSLWLFDDDEDIDHVSSNADHGDANSGEKKSASPEGHGTDSNEAAEDDDDDWYLGRAKEDFQRRLTGQNPQQTRDDDDPIQYVRNHRNAEAEREGEFGPEDDFEGSVRGSRRKASRDEDELDEEEFEETVLILILCFVVAGLLWVRQRLLRTGRNDHPPPQ
jgi:SEL1 protein